MKSTIFKKLAIFSFATIVVATPILTTSCGSNSSSDATSSNSGIGSSSSSGGTDNSSSSEGDNSSSNGSNNSSSNGSNNSSSNGSGSSDNSSAQEEELTTLTYISGYNYKSTELNFFQTKYRDNRVEIATSNYDDYAGKKYSNLGYFGKFNIDSTLASSNPKSSKSNWYKYDNEYVSSIKNSGANQKTNWNNLIYLYKMLCIEYLYVSKSDFVNNFYSKFIQLTTYSAFSVNEYYSYFLLDILKLSEIHSTIIYYLSALVKGTSEYAFTSCPELDFYWSFIDSSMGNIYTELSYYDSLYKYLCS